MMIKGIGVDITSIERFDLSHQHFIERILTKNELVVFHEFKTDKAKKEYLAGRFAAKEAFLKACHMGLGGMSFQEIEVMNTKEGCPYFTNSHAHLSISHDGGMAIAFVIIED